jgi:hypothetical protein
MTGHLMVTLLVVLKLGDLFLSRIPSITSSLTLVGCFNQCSSGSFLLMLVIVFTTFRGWGLGFRGTMSGKSSVC